MFNYEQRMNKEVSPERGIAKCMGYLSEVKSRKTENDSYNHERRCTSFSKIDPDGKMQQKHKNNLQTTR